VRTPRCNGEGATIFTLFDTFYTFFTSITLFSASQSIPGFYPPKSSLSQPCVHPALQRTGRNYFHSFLYFLYLFHFYNSFLCITVYSRILNPSKAHYPNQVYTTRCNESISSYFTLFDTFMSINTSYLSLSLSLSCIAYT